VRVGERERGSSDAFRNRIVRGGLPAPFAFSITSILSTAHDAWFYVLAGSRLSGAGTQDFSRLMKY
jgi:hypothetical protein